MSDKPPLAAGLDAPVASASTPAWLRWLPVMLALLFAVVVVRTAWLSEDAYFTFRTVDNWVHGYGARWNVAERVQVYTHPLWFVLVSALYFVMRNMEAAAFVASFACTAGAIYLLVRHIGRSAVATALALACLGASKAFVDYSTSGLENPLSHLLILAFVYRFWHCEDPRSSAAEHELSKTWVLGGLLLCNRMDLGLVLAPALIYCLWPPRTSLRRVLAIGLGFAPFLVWELVSLVYYGLLVPNTAIAKLGSGASAEFELRQGIRYFQNSLEWDPITLVCMTVVLLAALLRFRRAPKRGCAALGALIYLAYVFEIGGDYMSGRFLTAPLVVTAALLADRDDLQKAVARVAAVVIAALAFMAPNPTLLSGPDYGRHNLEGVDKFVYDERGYRFYYAGLLSSRKTPFLVGFHWYENGREARARAEAAGETIVIEDPNAGYLGYAAGPMVYVINPYALGDPLLARLPGRIGPSAPGHFYRNVPFGYAKAVVGQGPIKDEGLDAYWQDISLVTRGPLFSRERWAAMWRINTGAKQHLLDAYLHAELSYEQVSGERIHAIELRNGGATVRAAELLHGDIVEVMLERDDLYQLGIYRAGVLVFERELGRLDSNHARLVLHQVELPEELARAGYDEFRIVPVDGSGKYRMGNLWSTTRAQIEARLAEPSPLHRVPLFGPSAPATD